jgi:3-hydroxybutyrate dehydrogenase
MNTVLITGAGSGIGAGLATELARAGEHVILTDVAAEPIQALAAQLRSAGWSADSAALDVTSDASVETALGALSRRPQVLINNAGLQQVARLEEFPMSRWDFLIQVMLTGAARMTRAVLPAMRERNFGRIINMGSIHSLVGSPFKSAYVAAKHGLVGLSRVIALETSDVDITINTICPSYVRTPLVDKQIADQARLGGISESEVIQRIMLKPMPKGVFIELDELAGLTRFLVSRAARNITGQTIVVDGGWTAQ